MARNALLAHVCGAETQYCIINPAVDVCHVFDGLLLVMLV